MTQDVKTGNSARVLIADRDPTNRLIMREVLEHAGFDIVEARNGKEALKLYARSAPDVIVLDADMPLVDGFTVCKVIRAGEKIRNTPICMLTELDDFTSADRAYRLGATDFLCKPIAWPLFAHRVRYLVRASDTLNDMRGLMSVLPDQIFVLDKNGLAFDRPTGMHREYFSGAESDSAASFAELFDPKEHDQVQVLVKLALAHNEPQILEHFFGAGNKHLETRFVARDRTTVLAIVRDVTERKKSESQIINLAYYDRLTGLPNRHLFSEKLVDILAHAHSQQKQFAMLFIDLDGFKRINDTLGHSMGDELLKAVAVRLRDCMRKADHCEPLNPDDHQDFQLARLGGDEFVILCHDVTCENDAATVATRIMLALAQPLNCHDHQLVVTPSIGIAIYPQDGKTKEELLMNADSAMYRAKAAGRNNYQFYSGTMKIRSLHRLSIEGELRKAIENEHFELFYQPKVDVNTFSIVGAEALLRWNHAERGWISPVDFIPVAEETGLILPLGAWVLQNACEQLRKWCSTSLNTLSVSVNVSSQQLYSSDLVKTVTMAQSNSGINPAKLELEITESMLMQDIEETIATLVTLKEFGVGLSIDDFGTGYSSLSYLKRFPIDALKIDRSFVRDLQRDNDDAAICAAIIAMAHRLDLKVIAEGVETQVQVDYLKRHLCDQIQGYLISKPVAVKDFEALFLAHQPVAQNQLHSTRLTAPLSSPV